MPCPNAQAKLGANRDKFLLAPGLSSRSLLRLFRFLGQLMGMAIRTGNLLSLDLAPIVWRPLVGEPVTRRELQQVDETFVNFMRFLSECPAEELQGPTRSIFEKFVVQLSDKTRFPLLKAGEQTEVNPSNRSEFIRLAERARLEEASLQLKAIRRGIADVVPLPLLSLCTSDDLQTRVCGKNLIDIKLLKVCSPSFMSSGSLSNPPSSATRSTAASSPLPPTSPTSGRSSSPSPRTIAAPLSASPGPRSVSPPPTTSSSARARA